MLGYRLGAKYGVLLQQYINCLKTSTVEGFEKGKSLKPQPLCITLKTKRYMRQKPTSSPISQKKKKKRERKNYLIKQSKDAIIK